MEEDSHNGIQASLPFENNSISHTNICMQYLTKINKAKLIHLQLFSLCSNR